MRIKRTRSEDVHQHCRARGERIGQFVTVSGMPLPGTHLVHVVVLRTPARHLYRRVHGELRWYPPGNVERQFKPVVAGLVERDRGVDEQVVWSAARALRGLSMLRVSMPRRPAGSQGVAVELIRHPSQLALGTREITRKYLAKRNVCQRRSRSDHTPMIYHKAFSAVIYAQVCRGSTGGRLSHINRRRTTGVPVCDPSTDVRHNSAS